MYFRYVVVQENWYLNKVGGKRSKRKNKIWEENNVFANKNEMMQVAWDKTEHVDWMEGLWKSCQHVKNCVYIKCTYPSISLMCVGAQIRVPVPVPVH